MNHRAGRQLPWTVVAVAAASMLMAIPAMAAVPNPTVTGPIPQNAAPGDPSHDYTFMASPLMGAFGYVEQEFFIEGTANVYDTPPQTTATVVSGDHAYRSRIVVRRPADPKRFNGTVVLEWLNVTGGFDLDAIWLTGLARHLMREGYAWVGVSAQLAGIHSPGGLRAWSPVRYGTLDVTDGGTVLGDGLCYDIFSQAGQAVASPAGVDPMAGQRPTRIVALGASQSAFRLGRYHDSIQPLAGLFQGFLLTGANPMARTDLGVPVFKLHTETDENVVLGGIDPGGNPVPPLQTDSDVVRTWQVPGSSHIDGFFLDALYPLAARDGILLPPLGLCAAPEGSRVPFYHVIDAALGHLDRWVGGGTPPPTAPPIQTSGGAIVRDARGLALGGIRLAALAVPTAVNTGVNSGPFFCFLLGSHVPFDQATLDALYPDHGTYVDAVQAVVDGNVTAGFVVQRDAQATIKAAAMSDIGGMNGMALRSATPEVEPAARLEQNAPNPLAPSTGIRYSIRVPGRVRLTVYNILGQRVCDVVNRYQEAGQYRVVWAGTDDRGRPAPDGVYLYQLTAPGFADTRKLVIKR